MAQISFAPPLPWWGVIYYFPQYGFIVAFIYLLTQKKKHQSASIFQRLNKFLQFIFNRPKRIIFKHLERGWEGQNITVPYYSSHIFVKKKIGEKYDAPCKH